MKRFWKTAKTIASGKNFAVELDGRPVKLPSGKPLTVPFLPLAHAIADEWESAPQDFSPDDLPFTRLASTAQERVALHRDNIIGQLAAYGMNDLLCYRAETPDALVAQQNDVWGHWLNWAEASHGLQLQSTAGLVPINQSATTAATLQDILSAYSDYIIAALGVIVPALGSLVLGLALAANALSAEEASKAALLDELWQEEQWGADDEAVKRRTSVIADVAVSVRFMYLCKA
jgi:chaperone required for assembly of F1-ATPase